MAERCIVLGGWAFPPGILARIVGPEAVFIDVNNLMPSLVLDAKLRPDWESAVADIVNRHAENQPFRIAGWSTGAIMAYAAAKQLKPTSALLLSATPSFCRRPGFPIGQKPGVLKAMREKLMVEPEEVLGKFYEQCGIIIPIASPLGPLSTNGEGKKSKAIKENSYSKSLLIDGLHFLEQASVLPVTPLPCPVLFVHGREDLIVPFKAGKRFAEELGADIEEFDGGHAFFWRNGDEAVNGRVREFGGNGYDRDYCSGGEIELKSNASGGETI